MEHINEFHKEWIERTRQSIASWSKQPVSLEEKKETTGTLEPTESYKRGQIEELISFANLNNLWISLSELNIEFLSKGHHSTTLLRLCIHSFFRNATVSSKRLKSLSVASSPLRFASSATSLIKVASI